MSSTFLVAAIDFGTTYSGWAFSFKHEFERDPIKISSKHWLGGQLVSQKGPTCVLIHPDKTTLHSFGYDAESKFAELAELNNHTEWFFFKRFKMTLYGKIGLERNIMLKDEGGKQLQAKTVFALSIKYLKDDLIKVSRTRIEDGGINESDIHWVLTVPAIWNDAAKQFMREAAEEAGIRKDLLTIALEPEAASLFCRHLPVEKCLGRDKVSLAKFQEGKQYLVLDAGGGTIDITVHEVLENGNLKELHKASGGAWGGTKVDEAFEMFLTEIIGQKAMNKFKKHHMEDYIELFRDFEIKKRMINPTQTVPITIRIPLSFVEVTKKERGKSMKKCIDKSNYKNKLFLAGDKLRIDACVMKGFFGNSLKSVLNHVSSLLAEPNVACCSAIVMVGGFSESQMLQKHVEEKFTEMKIIVPEDAGIAVLKGAVIFGHNPTTIAERICKFTYGENISHMTSDECNHPRGKISFDDNGERMCMDIFEVHVKVGQSVKLDEEQDEHTSSPVSDTQSSIELEIYASPNSDPVFVTDPDCRMIGKFEVPIPDTSLVRLREFGTTFLFGDTEIKVKVVDKETDEVTIRSVDFLG